MKSFAALLTVAVTCLALLSTNADAARRLGGGSSFGKQRAVPTQQRSQDTTQQRSQQAAPQQANPQSAQTPPQPAKPANRWLGPLAGLAIGAGLGALFSNFLGGSGGGILLAILAAVAAVFLISRFMRPRQTQAQYQTAQGPAAFEAAPVKKPTFDIPPIGETASALNADNPISVGFIPADFPVETFLRGAKGTFIRLQAANDRKDLDDIREYTTPEVFAEISLQTQERGNEAQKTDVLKLEAEVLDVTTNDDLTVVSVRYTGEISENGGPGELFDEVWNVQRDHRSDKSGWMLAGIQQGGAQQPTVH